MISWPDQVWHKEAADLGDAAHRLRLMLLLPDRETGLQLFQPRQQCVVDRDHGTALIRFVVVGQIEIDDSVLDVDPVGGQLEDIDRPSGSGNRWHREAVQ